MVGASLEEPEEEDDARSTSSSIIALPKEGCYEIVGTVKDAETTKPEFVKEVINVSNIQNNGICNANTLSLCYKSNFLKNVNILFLNRKSYCLCALLHNDVYKLRHLDLTKGNQGLFK